MKRLFILLVVMKLTSCVSTRWMGGSLAGAYEKSPKMMSLHFGPPADIFIIQTLQGYPGKHQGYRYFFLGEDGELRCHEIFFRQGVYMTSFLLGPPTWKSPSNASGSPILKDKIRIRVLSADELTDPVMRSRIEQTWPHLSRQTGSGKN